MLKSTGNTITLLFLMALSCAASQEVSDNVQQLYSEAQAHERQGQVAQAIQDYLEMIRVSPELAAAHNNLGRLYYQQGKLEKAAESLRHSCKLDPRLVAPRALLGFALFQMGNFTAARQELETATKLSPGDVNIRLFLARSMIALHEPQPALKILEPLKQERPDNTDVLFTLGNLYSDLAESTIGEIQKVDPNSYLIEVILARFAEVKQIYSDAAEHYKRAIEKAPDVPDLYYKYAHALWAGGDAAAALPQYKRAVALNPYDYRALWEEARVELSDNPDEAVRLSTQALELKPDVADAFAIRGRALLSLHKPADATRDLKKAAALEPDDAAIHFQLARAYRQQGLAEEAKNENALYERLDRESHTGKENRQNP